MQDEQFEYGCSECGATVLQEDMVCPNCGASLEETITIGPNRWRIVGIALTVVITFAIAITYLILECYLYASDFGCGCSSGCLGFYVSKFSKIIGHILLIFSTVLFIRSSWRINKLSRWWTVPSVIIFIVALYGNGHSLYYSSPCGFSLREITFYVFENEIADPTTISYGYFSLDSLREKKYVGNLLGYYIFDNNLYIYRIAAEPLKLKTGFLFWKFDKEEMMKQLSYELSPYRNPSEKLENENKIELIGGMNMPLKAFWEELKVTGNWDFARVIDKQLINSNDGTTRVILTVR